jgi:hypothetical protein
MRLAQDARSIIASGLHMRHHARLEQSRGASRTRMLAHINANQCDTCWTSPIINLDRTKSQCLTTRRCTPAFHDNSHARFKYIHNADTHAFLLMATGQRGDMQALQPSTRMHAGNCMRCQITMHKKISSTGHT